MELYNQKLRADRKIETLFKGINSKNRDKIQMNYKKQDEFREEMNKDAFTKQQKKHIKYDDDHNEIYTPTQQEKRQEKLVQQNLGEIERKAN